MDSDDAPETELDLAAWVTYDEKGLPSVLTLEDPFNVQVNVGRGFDNFSVSALSFSRPRAVHLDILNEMESRPAQAMKYMRQFVTKLVEVAENPNIPVSEAMLGKNLSVPDFYRAWECASAFLPKPKKRAADS